MAVIRQRAQVFNQPIGVVRASSGGVQVGEAISRFADNITQMTYEVAAEEAQTRGIDAAKAVEEAGLRTFNPETGKPEAFEAPKGFGRIAAQSYQSVVDRRFEASMEDELRMKAQEIAQKYPYDANGYEKVMSDYLGAMSENAQGKYKTFIAENGAKFLASTKLNIQSRAAARARAQLSQSIVNGLDKATDMAYDSALAGGFMVTGDAEFSESGDLAAREVGNVANGVSSGLLKSGADAKARTQLNTAIAKGGLEYIIGNTKSSADRNAVQLAVRTGGRMMSSVPKELRPQVEALIGYIEPSNVEAVITHSGKVSADYDAVERDNILRMQAQAEADARRNAMMFEQSVDGYANISNQIAITGFESEDQNAVTASLSGSNMLLGNLQNNLAQRFMNGSLTQDQYDSSLQDARRGMLQPYLIEAAAQGNVEELRVAAITRNPADMASLTPKQREFVYAMHESQLFDVNEDTGFVREVLAANVNSIRDQREKQVTQFNLAQEVTALGEEAALGDITDAQFDAMRQKIAAETGRSLTATQAQSELDRLNKQRAFGMINLGASGMTSDSLNRLSTFVQTQGEKTGGMTPEEIALGQGILAKTTPENTNDITGRLDSIRVKVAREEEQRQKRLTKAQNFQRIASGGGNTNFLEDRKLAQEMIDELGIKLNDRSSETEEVYSLLRTVQPQGMIDNFDRIASGLPVEGAEILLNHFARLSNDPSATGISINRFGDALSAGTFELLNDVLQVRNTLGGSANEIAAALVARKDDPKSRMAMDVALGKQTPTAYVMKYTDGWFSSADPVIAAELAPAVEYLALTGKSAEQINGRLEALINQKYPETKYIADPRFPVGSLKRSRYSLEATIPNDEDRDEFLRTIETQLPSGFSLFSGSNAPTRGGYRALGTAASVSDSRQVMLVPDEQTAGASYVAYFVDEANELRPLMYEKEGELVWPAFDLSEISQFQKARVAREREEKEQEIQDREEYLKKVRRDRESRFVPLPM